MPENEYNVRDKMSQKNKEMLRSVQAYHDYGMRTTNDILGKPNYTEEDFTGDDWKDTNPIVKYNLAHGTSIFSNPQLRALQLAKQEKEFRENHPYLASIASDEETMGSPDFRSTLRGLYLAPNNNVRREIYKDNLTKNIAVPVLSAAGLGAFGSMPAFAAQSIWAYDSMKDLTSENGIKKTFDLVNKGQYGKALRSGAGDAFDLAIIASPFKTLGGAIKSIRTAKPAIEVTRAAHPVGLLDNAEWQPQIWDTALPEYSRPKIVLTGYKNGGKAPIHIKKENLGKFTDYCGGKVTNECIARGKNSPNPAIRKRATFAANSRSWAKKRKHFNGGNIPNWFRND